MSETKELISENNELLMRQLIDIFIEIFINKKEDFEKDKVYIKLFNIYFNKRKKLYLSPIYGNLNYLYSIYQRVNKDYDNFNEFYELNIMNKLHNDKNEYFENFLCFIEGLIEEAPICI